MMKASPADTMIFSDDDFPPVPDFFKETKRSFEVNVGIVVDNSGVIADGAGLYLGAVLEVLTTAVLKDLNWPRRRHGGRAVVRAREYGPRLDENPRLYAWPKYVSLPVDGSPSQRASPYQEGQPRPGLEPGSFADGQVGLHHEKGQCNPEWGAGGRRRRRAANFCPNVPPKPGLIDAEGSSALSWPST
ncbi:hypothetical protein ACMDCR_10615 [Labrys okinawensis]|uniref:hypothetical protein n=1 Tax=Labrys okinawensis TaxID=346911 RepID=UPI0039BD90D2